MEQASDTQADFQADFERASAVKEAYQSALLAKANVVGVGVGLRRVDGGYTNQVAILVMVKRKVSWRDLAPDDIIPRVLDGIPVDVQTTGEFQPE